MMGIPRNVLHRLLPRRKRQRRLSTAFGFAAQAMPAGMGFGYAQRASDFGKSDIRQAFSQPAYGQRVDDLTRMLGKNSGKIRDGVKVPTVSHPMTKEDLTRRST